MRFLLDMEVPQGPAGMGFGSGQTNGISALSVDDAVVGLWRKLWTGPGSCA